MSDANGSHTPLSASDAAISDALARGVSDVISAAIGVGTSVAKAFADATARGKPVAPAAGGGGLEAFIHYGVAAVTNVMGMVATGIETGTGAPPPKAPLAARAAAAASDVATDKLALPVVQPGGRLRIPLSVENTSAEPLSEVAVRCLRITDSRGAASPDSVGVRCEPAFLNIAPRDFEKTTVFIDTTPDLAPGRYEVVIAIGALGFESRLQFDVRH